MAAQYADGFNIPYIGPEDFLDRNQKVDRHCEKIGRDPAEIERSVNLGFYMGADAASAEKNRKNVERFDAVRRKGMLAGTPAEAVETIGKYADAGAQGLNIAFRNPLDWEAVEAFISEVLPHFHK